MNPYNSLDEKAFWKLAIANRSPFDITNLWDPKFSITPKDKIVTFGSCFAQHIGKALQERGFSWYNTEPAPRRIPDEILKSFNYNVFSSRTGNIYTTSLLKQWTEWAIKETETPAEFWIKNNRIYDPFRPNIEPDGFKNVEEMRASRDQAIKSFRQAIAEAKYFIFTLGLTESWVHRVNNYEYPMCPGTIAGDFDPTLHKFSNQDYNFIIRNLIDAMDLMRSINVKLKFIFTVSPVPLTATNSGQHVLVATMSSKSILRAVAGKLATRPGADYFPSYEIINSPVFKGMFFEPNQRSVNPVGVKFVMDSFFNSLLHKYNTENIRPTMIKDEISRKKDDLVCEEELLGAFGGK